MLVWGLPESLPIFSIPRMHCADPRPAARLTPLPEQPRAISLHSPGSHPVLGTLGVSLHLSEPQFSPFQNGTDRSPQGCRECPRDLAQRAPGTSCRWPCSCIRRHRLPFPRPSSPVGWAVFQPWLTAGCTCARRAPSSASPADCYLLLLLLSPLGGVPPPWKGRPRQQEEGRALVSPGRLGRGWGRLPSEGGLAVDFNPSKEGQGGRLRVRGPVPVAPVPLLGPWTCPSLLWASEWGGAMFLS